MLIEIITMIVVGFVAGYVAGEIMKTGKKRFWENVAIGIIGSFLGSWLFGLLGIAFFGLVGQIVGAVLGAIILLWVIRKIR